MDFGNEAKLISALCRARRDGALASRVGGRLAALVQHHGQRPRPAAPALAPAPRPARASWWAGGPTPGTRVRILPLALLSCVALGKALRALEPRFPPVFLVRGDGAGKRL